MSSQAIKFEFMASCDPANVSGLLPLALTFAQILPPPREYVNIHPNCFHLWEIEWNG